MSLRLGLGNRFILHPFVSNAPIILFSLYQIVWTVECTGPNSRQRSPFFFPFSVFHITSTSVLKTFLLFMTVAVLSLYQYPVNCMSSNVEDIFTYTVNYRYYVHRPGLKYT